MAEHTAPARCERRFAVFSHLGAFNDNAFKNALVILVAFLGAQLTVADVNFYTTRCRAVHPAVPAVFGDQRPAFDREKARPAQSSRF